MKARRHTRAARLELQTGSMMAEGCCAVWSLLTTHYSLLARERLGVTQKDGLVCLEKAFPGGKSVSATRFCAFPAFILITGSIGHHVPDSLDSLVPKV